MALHSMCQPGIAPAPRRVPEHGLVLELRLREPEDEVRRVLLALVHGDPGTRLQVLLVQEGELPVPREPADVEVHVSARDVGEALRLDPGDQVDHVLDMLGGPADHRGRRAAEQLEVAEEGLRVELGDLPDGLALFPRALEHLVFALVGVPGEVADVGDVHDVADGEPEVLECPPEDVLEQVGAEVADVRVVVHGGPAAVHPDLARLDRHELLHLPPHRVPELQRHDVLSLFDSTARSAGCRASRPAAHSPATIPGVTTVRELARMFKIDGSATLDEPMAAHSSFRIGGPADLYVVPTDGDDAAAVLRACAKESVPVFLLGGGTNILVSDLGIRGVVLDLSRLNGVRADGPLLIARGGTPMSEVAEFALGRGLSGLEFAYALPGSVGGAVWMNARCYGAEIGDVLDYVDYLGPDLTKQRYEIRPADWSYKRSPFQGHTHVILEAGFRLAPGDRAGMEALMQSHRSDRESKGHFLHPCAGSIFKNNRAFGAPSGQLIDSLGLKGTKIGGAQVAPFHGNIFINTGDARASDMRALIEMVEEKVRTRLGLELEREVLLVGEWP